MGMKQAATFQAPATSPLVAAMKGITQTKLRARASSRKNGIGVGT